MSDRLTEERIAKNDAVFREANENISEVAQEQGLTVPPIPFICECADMTCTEIIRLVLAKYAEVRSNPRRFMIFDGHDAEDDSAALVERCDGYMIVEKTGHAGEVAEQLASE